MPGWLGPWELIILGVIVALLFGTKRLPELGRSLGRSAREIKEATTVKDVLAAKDEAKRTVGQLNPLSGLKGPPAEEREKKES